LLKIDRVTFAYDEKTLLKSLSGEVMPGKLISLTGPSGSGKSTLAKIISGHLRPKAGSVELHVASGVFDLTTGPSRRAFTVCQDNDLFPWQRVEKQIEFFQSAETRVGSLSTSEILAAVRLEASAKLFPKELSGGMQKRLGLARALALNPNVLVLDEVFSSQEESLQNDILSGLKAHWRAAGTIVLLITHDSRLIKGLVDGSLSLK
jgi:ABC-type nitrate/sulfonate/bicarbonate transport system ATPase subunit